MKALTFLSLVLALGACLLAFAGMAGSGDSSRPGGASDVRSEAALLDELANLRDVAQELSGRLENLDSRLTSLELAPPASVQARQQVPVEAPEENTRVLEDLAAALETGQASSSNELQNLVLEVIASKEDAERREREERRLQATQDRVNERIERYREELGLNSRQANDMARVLIEEELKRDELFQSMRDGGMMNRDSIRSSMTELRDTSRQQLSSILTPEQYDGYVEMSDWRRGSWGRGSDREGGGGRGRGRDI